MTKSWKEVVQNRMVVMIISTGQKENLHNLLNLDHRMLYILKRWLERLP